MNNIDLNIDNYDYEDILNLFKIKIDFQEDDLKKAKKHVLAMHPDKSGLDKKYFLFFSSAYKILYSVYEFRNKAKNSENNDISYENTEYLVSEDKNNKKTLELLNKGNNMKPEKFNIWFNELFEKVKLDNEYEGSGYGDWLKSNEDNIINVTNQNDMHKAINEKKETLRKQQLVKHKNINEYNNNNYCDLTNSCPEEYSSDLFSKFQFEDLKKAHTESVVPVNDKDYSPKYNNIEEARIKRQQQNLKPLTEKEAESYLKDMHYNENFIGSHRAYKLAKQQQDAENANNKWWSALRMLK